MKTLRLILVAFIGAITITGYAQNDDGKIRPVLSKVGQSHSISLSQAGLNAQITEAINVQVNPKIVLENNGGFQIVKIRTSDGNYIISGTFDEWLRWFRLRPVKFINDKKIID